MSEASARKAVYKRSKSVCERCGNWVGQSFHHRKNKSQGGKWTPANGLHLCGDGTTGCHGWVTEHPAESYKNGWLVRSNDDPATTPVRYRGRLVLLDDNGDVSEVEESDNDAHR